MGIFAKRDIKANEELTFNYNVDRYGCVARASSYCCKWACADVLLQPRRARMLLR